MKPDISIIEAIESEHLMRPLFGDDLSTWANWLVLLKATFGLEMSRAERKVFRKHTDRTKPPKQQVKECWALCGRRAGKSVTMARVAAFLGLFVDWTPFIALGETPVIMVIAKDRDQARVIFNYIKAVFELPVFRGEVVKELSSEIHLKNGVMIAIKTCDFGSIRGFTIVSAICDEVAVWHETGARPAEEIFRSLRPATMTVPNSLLIGISTVYGKWGPLYTAFKDHYGKNDPDVLVWRASSFDMNLTLSKSEVMAAVKKDPTAGRADYLSEFREDLESYMGLEQVEAVTVSRREMLPKCSDAYYQAFVDVSGGKRDSFALAIAHQEGDGGKIVLDRLEERKPPMSPYEIVAEFARILKEYGLDAVTGDRYAGEWTVQAFGACGITYFESERTKDEIYREFYPLVATGAVELLDSQQLRNQLSSLERTTRPGGKDKIDHPRAGHDDTGNVAAGVCVLASDLGMLEDAEIEWIDLWGADPYASERNALVRRLNG